MSDQLDQLTNAELNEVFAVEVAGFSDLRISGVWEFSDDPANRTCMCGNGPDGKAPIPLVADSADAVLPWLEKHAAYKVEYIGLGEAWKSRIDVFYALSSRTPEGFGLAPTFARAATIALIRAHRARKQ